MLFLKGHLKESEGGENTDKGLAGMSGECDQKRLLETGVVGDYYLMLGA